MIHTAPIDLEQLAEGDSTSKPIELDVWSTWYSHGFPVDEIVEAYCAVHEKVDAEDTAHIVTKVQTLEKPIDHADIVADSATRWACDCGRFQYHEKVDLEMNTVMDWGNCHHIESVDKSLRADQDKNQETL